MYSFMLMNVIGVAKLVQGLPMTNVLPALQMQYNMEIFANVT